MEPNEQPQPNPPTGGQVMDVKPPESLAPSPMPTPSSEGDIVISSGGELTSAEPVAPPPPPPPPPPAEPTDNAPSPSPAEPVPGNSGQEQTPRPSTANQAVTPPKRKKGSGIGLIIFAAILVMAGLIVLAVKMYMDQSKGDIPTTTNNQQSNQAPQEVVQPATQEDIDADISEINKNADSINDDEDFQEDELSDDKLGL
jgi:hypothetical protein